CYVDKSDFKIYYQDYADESGKGSDPVLLVQPEVYYLKMKSSNYDLDLEENDSSPIVSVEYADKESKDIVIFRTEDGNAYYYSGNAYFDKAGYNRTYSENAKNYVSRMARIGIKRGSWINRGKWTSMSQDDFRALIGSESSKIYLRLETREEDAEKFIIKDPDGKGVLLHSIEEYCKNVVFRNGNYPGDYSDDTVGFYDTDDTVLYINSADSYEGEYTRVELPDGKKISDIDWSRTFSYTTDLLITFKNGKSYVRSGGALEYNEEISGFAGHIKKTYCTGAGGFAVLMDDGHYYLFNY
ncbi:MAG: hypothetical protein J6252_04500, partial [Clostridia bacterium]|nr:hypothetical protein [Clostridia bacterium]